MCVDELILRPRTDSRRWANDIKLGPRIPSEGVVINLAGDVSAVAILGKILREADELLQVRHLTIPGL